MIRRPALALISLSLALLLVASCRSQNAPVTNNSSDNTIVSVTPPFQTREPERYRATRTITNVTAEGRTNVTKVTIARDGEFRRIESELFAAKTIFVIGPQGKYLLLPNDKVYVDQTEGAAPPDAISEDESSADRLLHTESGTSSYQQLGTEAVSGRKTNKYRVTVNSANAANVSSSETLIWIDEALGMPIRSETKSSDGSRSTMELSELSLEVDKNLFQVPSDYKKVSVTELARYLKPR